MTTTDLARAESAPQLAMTGGGVQAMRAHLDEMKETLKLVGEYQRSIMTENVDYGTIPGTPKPTLYKPGAEKLLFGFRLRTEPKIIASTADFERGLFAYEVERSAYRIEDGMLVGSAIGACNSFEKRYRWRNGQRVCPECGLAAIIKGKKEYGGGWLCFKAKGGCGTKWGDGAEVIEKQEVGQVENPDLCDLQNTIMKQADKRALVAVALLVTMSSALFTQDLEDVGREPDRDDWREEREGTTQQQSSRQPTQQRQQQAARPRNQQAVRAVATMSQEEFDEVAQAEPRLTAVLKAELEKAASAQTATAVDNTAAIAERAKWMARQPVCPGALSTNDDEADGQIAEWRNDVSAAMEAWPFGEAPITLTNARMKKLGDVLIDFAGSPEEATRFVWWTFGSERLRDLQEGEVVALERFVQGEFSRAFVKGLLWLTAEDQG